MEKHCIKLQIFGCKIRSQGPPSRVIIRVHSTDVAEVCLDVKSGTCWMGLLAPPSERTLQCYQSVEFVLNLLGQDGARLIGSFDRFSSVTVQRLVQQLPQRSTLCLCEAGRLLGWPCVLNETGGRLLLYFSDTDNNNNNLGIVMETKYARRLDDPWEERPACDHITCLPEVDKYGLPTHIGHGFQSICLEPSSCSAHT